jgi:epoxyqueuosine reductase
MANQPLSPRQPARKPLGPFDRDRLKRVERPTNTVTDAIQRVDLRSTAYELARRGDFGPAVQEGVQNSLPGRYPLSAAQKDLIDHIAEIRPNPVATTPAELPADLAARAHHLKAAACFLKADDVGICRVPVSAYYSHTKLGVPIEPRFDTAIVILMRKDWPTMRASTGRDWMGDPISFQAYAHLGLVAETLADYLRQLGWGAEAQYGPSLVNRYSVLLPPLLLAAGLGELSRAGIVLHPYLGLGFKAAAILTNLPLVTDRPIDFGLQRFCASCKICAENCPSKAISTGAKAIYNGYETWKLDVRRCASFNFLNKHGTMCNRCVKSCPWTQPPTWPHNLVRALVMRSRLAQGLAIRAARWLKTGQSHAQEQWWLRAKLDVPLEG